MNKLFALIAVLAVSMSAVDAAPAGRGRASMSSQMESRAAVTKKSVESTVVSEPTVVEEKAEDTAPEAEVKKDMREREKAACIQNNIGVGATFVWASK